MNNNEFSFRIINNEGIEVKCDTLAIFTPEGKENNDETYVIYTDYSIDNEKNLKVYISRLVKDGEDFKLENIEDYDKYPQLLMKVEEEYKKINAI